jgi:hypothetical protein
MEHITGDAWWTDYQVVSYKLTSKRGNRDQLVNMVNSCHAAGVKVIVGESFLAQIFPPGVLKLLRTDVILNHMAGIKQGKGVAGSSFTHYDYPGLYKYSNFHHCGLEPGDDIKDYSNREEVQTCELVNLAE